jgi:hypothetical protein
MSFMFNSLRVYRFFIHSLSPDYCSSLTTTLKCFASKAVNRRGKQMQTNKAIVVTMMMLVRLRSLIERNNDTLMRFTPAARGALAAAISCLLRPTPIWRIVWREYLSETGERWDCHA